MIDSLYIGATGMNAQQTGVDTTANNLANVNTAGFKRNRVEFEDLVYRTIARANAGDDSRPVVRIGAGAAVAGTAKIFSAGDIKKTGEPLDVAINGNGFFEVVQADGTLAYTRSGNLRVNSEGQFTTVDGLRLSTPMQLPADTTSVRIEQDGRVFVRVPDQTEEVEVGRFELAAFTNPGGLSAVGDNLLVATDASGPAQLGVPAESGLGTLQQGYLESSNVKLIDELIGLILAQRAYEMNAKVVQASDEMLGITNNLHRA
jgi:flagellar basal-body rod protein FlgG